MSESFLNKRFLDYAFGIIDEDLQDDINLDIGIFEQLCYKSINTKNLEPTEFVKINKFISIIEKINDRYPFLHLPSFIHDFVKGMYSKKLLTKYHLRNYDELKYIVEKILKLDFKRKKSSENNLKENLQNLELSKLYNFIIEHSQNFNHEIFTLLNHNLLRATIILYLLKNNGTFTKQDLIKNIEFFSHNFQNKIRLLDDKDISDIFNEYINNNLEIKINNIISSLISKKEIRQDIISNELSLGKDYTRIPNIILETIHEAQQGIIHVTFHKKLLHRLPLLQLIPMMGIWESALLELEEKGEIIRKKTFWKFSPYQDQLFSKENYDNIMSIIKQQTVNYGKTKFFGRNIVPDRFIEELEILDRGNLDDVDDQVTRLAGLVLADSVLLQSPPEELREFDFAIDISNYRFRQEQIEAMKEINFEVIGNIIHCKVMIHEKITKELIEKLKENIPQGQQGIIFSFMPISNIVKNLISKDKIIQIIDKTGIRIWVSITPVVPIRLNSISKVIYGELRGKIVQVKSLNYESGLASVIEIYSNIETNVFIGSLQEINLYESSPQDFKSYSKNYCDFLNILTNNSSTEDFEGGLFDETVIDFARKSKKYKIKLKNNQVEIDLSEYRLRTIFKCSCYHWIDTSHSFTFCKHFIAALNHIGLAGNYFDSTWENDDNLLFVALQIFIQDNDEQVIRQLAEKLDESKLVLLKSYLEVYCELTK